jgi:hypothetical protein
MREKVDELFRRGGLTKAIVEGLKELDADGYDSQAAIPKNRERVVVPHATPLIRQGRRI